MVDSVAGTTIDPVDSLVELGGEIWRFVDTAGLRRRVRQASGMEYYASLRTAPRAGRAEVAVVLLDAAEPLTEQDQRVIAEVVEAGRALVLAFNKWDLRRRGPPRAARARDRAATWPGSPGRRGSTCRHDRARGRQARAAHLRIALDSWDRRISTGRLNTWLGEVVGRDAAAASRRWARPECCSPPRPTPVRRGSCCSPPASSRPATGASSSGGCARTSTSPARRSRSRCGCGRSAAGRAGRPGRDTAGVAATSR